MCCLSNFTSLLLCFLFLFGLYAAYSVLSVHCQIFCLILSVNELGRFYDISNVTYQNRNGYVESMCGQDAQCVLCSHWCKTPFALDEIFCIIEQGNCYQEDVWFTYRLLSNIRKAFPFLCIHICLWNWFNASYFAYLVLFVFFYTSSCIWCYVSYSIHLSYATHFIHTNDMCLVLDILLYGIYSMPLVICISFCSLSLCIW